MSKLGRSLAFGSICTATVVASAVGTMTLDRYGVVSLTAPSEASRIERPARIEVASVIIKPIPVRPAPAPADRFAFVSVDAVRLLLPPPLAELRELPELALPPQGAVPPPAPPSSAWTVETQPETPAVAEPAPAAPSPSTRMSAWTQDGEPQASPRRAVPYPRSHSRTPALTKRLAEISPKATKRLMERFAAAKVSWPPVEVAFITIKDERTVELHARAQEGGWQFVHRYKVLAASGGPGPKLRQGDKQVPEGIYRISFLNPLSAYHVSLRVNYPNTFDRRMASADGRSGNLGGDIMFHGKNVSAGCIAVGDEGAEELFVLGDHVGPRNIQVIIAPTDFRRNPIPVLDETKPKWLPKLYAEVAAAMVEYKAPPRPILAAPMGLTAFFGN